MSDSLTRKLKELLKSLERQYGEDSLRVKRLRKLVKVVEDKPWKKRR